jgi:hypothetical protein
MIYFDHLGYLGQLGNQMFQYASIKGICKNKGYDFCLSNHEKVHIDFLGNKLRTEIFIPFKLTHFNRDNIKLPPQNIQTLQERHFHFDEDLYNNCPDNINLFGYFQTEKYFSHIRKELLEDFEFVDSIKNPCEQMIKTFDNPIALHIRRGDYLINSGNHNNLTLDYYEKALSYFDSDREVIIFSDDPKWCKEQKVFEDDRFLISDSGDPYIDLCLMSMCVDFIIANSTYSWWGAWLSKNENKKIVTSSEWFGPNNQHHDIKDLFPESWIVIK